MNKSTFDALKRKSKSSLSQLKEAADKLSANNYGDDKTDFWSPTVDKSGNGYAVIRFLPQPDPDATPWVRYWDHGFKGPTGRWYIERSLTSIGENDSIGEYNSMLWNSGSDEDKKIARTQKRRLHYVSNVLVLADPANPENDGKVFKFQYGKKIFDKILDKIRPEFEDEKPVNPFDLWTGANFRLKIRNVEGYRNYDKSEFEAPSPLSEDEDKIREVFEKTLDLSEYADPKNYKTREELHTKLVSVLGFDPLNKNSRANLAHTESATPKVESSRPAVGASVDDDDSEADDTLDYFKQLAAED